MYVSPAKHSYVWLPLESVTTGQTDGQTDARQSDPYVPLCFEGDTKTTQIRQTDFALHKKHCWQLPFHYKEKTATVFQSYGHILLSNCHTHDALGVGWPQFALQFTSCGYWMHLQGENHLLLVIYGFKCLSIVGNIIRCSTVFYSQTLHTVDGFIFGGTNFRGLNRHCIFDGIKICGFYIFLHKSYKKSLFRGYWNSWIGPSRKTTKIGTPRKLSHSHSICKKLTRRKTYESKVHGNNFLEL